MKSHLKYCAQVLGPEDNKDVELLESVQRAATKMIRGLEHLSREVQEVGLVYTGEEDCFSGETSL